MSADGMRMMRPSDLPRVWELAGEQNDRDGTSYPVPVIFNPDGTLATNVPLALVTETSKGVEQGHVFLRTLEMMSFGVNPRATVASLRQVSSVFYLLEQKGYDDLHVLVPRKRAGAISHRLATAMGLERDDDRLVHLYRTLRGE